ncbi:M20 family metallo-hydrolase [Wukongibacter baidiensis]|uniref:M20 family metallo-hydrolase n=1 Tax=Wukongibacter baidiensis TaxID=1723361 RepID=UPI003D7F9FE1
MSRFNINPKKIEERINRLASVGVKDEKLWRAIYTLEDQEAKELVARWMTDEGLKFHQDTVGNVFGRLDTSTHENSEEEVILVGSHIDTVKDGGAYDGAAGIIVGIVALSALNKKYGRPKIPVEVVALAEEEGSRFPIGYIGSRAIVEGLSKSDLEDKDEEGITLKEAMSLAGYDPSKVQVSKRNDIKKYIELHIEQGPVLENTKSKIGLVENITGIVILSIEVMGREDHAGTTPMNMRLDALVGASKLICKIPSLAANTSDTATATVGTMNVEPGSSNVVPNKVKFLVDIRDVNSEKLSQLKNLINDEAIALESSGYKVLVNCIADELPVKLDSELIDMAEEVVKNRNIPYLRMNSGAGHDAQIFTEKVPTCLLFVPCKDGRSHSPKEYASPEDLALGAEVLAELLYKVAWE